MATMLSKVWRRSSRAICRASGRWRNANWFAADGCLCVAVLSALRFAAVESLGRQILIENPGRQVARRSGAIAMGGIGSHGQHVMQRESSCC